MADNLAGKRYVVTGAASGMGRSTLIALVREGAHVVGFDRSDAAEVEKAVEGLAGKASFLRCDVGEENQVKVATKKAVHDMGGLDGLVHAAGVAPTIAVEDISYAQYNDVMRINMGGTFLANQAVFPYLKERGGRILNFASANGALGTSWKAHYAASKGAVLAWTRSIAHSWGKYGITANAICPAIVTDMYRATRASLSPEEFAAHDEQLARSVPIGGALGDVERDFAPFIVFYAGDGARFVTGQTLSIDGGAFMVRRSHRI